MQTRADWQLIGEVADGLEAVLKARHLQPDLVLLDIGLPTLNGIEAARQIRAVCSTAKILFVSQESSPDIVEAAIENGGSGYVNKNDAGTEIITAVEAILLGRQYLSRSIATRNSTEGSSSLAQLGENRLIPTSRPQRHVKSWHHEVGFYPDDRSLWDARIEFIGAALSDGNVAISIASALHQDELLSRLQAQGVDISAVIGQGRYVALDAAEALSSLIVNGLPDPLKFSWLVGELITRATVVVDGDTSRIFVCGEGTTLLWQQGNVEGVVRLEQLWDEMARSCAVQVHCGYMSSSFYGETGKDAYGRICAEHSAVLSL
jgi:CheY-like chemotaxis protein